MSLGIYRQNLEQTAGERQLLADDFSPDFSPGAGFVAGFKRASNLTQALGSGIRYLGRKRGNQLSPEEVKERYGVEVDESVNEDYAEYLQEERRNKEEQDFVLSNIDPKQRGSTAFPLLGGLAKGFADPVGLLAGGASLKALGALKSVAFGTRALQAAKSTSIINAIKTGAAEGIMESVYSTPALMWEQKNVLGEDYSKEDIFIDIAANIAGNAFFNTIGNGLKRVSNKFGDKAAAEIVQNQTNQSYKDVIPNPKFQETAILKDTYSIRPGDTPVDYTPLIPGEKKLFAVSKSGALDAKSVRSFDDTFGDTVMMSDNHQFAKNNANSDLVQDPANMIEVDLDEVNLLDLEASPLPDNIRMEVESYLQSKGLNKADIDGLLGGPDNLSSGFAQLKRIQEFEDAGVDFNDINKIVESKGYDGYTHIGGMDKDGVKIPETQHNVVNLFNPEKAQVANTYKGVPNPKRAPDVSEEFKAQQQYDTDPNNEFLSDPEVNQRFNDLPPTPADEMEVQSQLSERMAQSIEKIEAMKKREDLPQFEGRFESIDRLKMVRQNTLELARASEFCLRRNSG